MAIFFTCPVRDQFFSFSFCGLRSQETATGRATVIVSPVENGQLFKNQTRFLVLVRLTHVPHVAQKIPLAARLRLAPPPPPRPPPPPGFAPFASFAS